MEQGSVDWIDVIVPKTAEEVKVTNIINLYFMRVQRLPIDRERKDNILRSLQQEVTLAQKKGLDSSYIPKVGDHVIVSTGFLDDLRVDLPNWICRGYVTDTSPSTTDIFLLDDGITINVPPDSFIKYRPNLSELPPLSETVGIYTVLPMADSRILKEWPRSTIDFAKELLYSAKKVYFQCLVTDKETKRNYGEFYLVVDNRNICLSKALIYAFVAVPLYDELLNAVKNIEGSTKLSVPYMVEKKKPVPDDNVPTPPQERPQNNSIQKFNKKRHNDEKIFIDSEFDVQPQTHVPDARFTKFVHKALEYQGVNKPKQIQSYMWPAIVRGFSVIAIGSERSGKTMGFTAPIVSLIASNEEAQLKSSKPLALILCASVNECMAVADQCKKIADYHPEVKTLAAFNGVSENAIMVALLNKIQILVSTPPFLCRLLEKKNFRELDLSKLLYLIIDEADILLSKYMRDLMKLIRNHIATRIDKNSVRIGSMQTILVSRTWTASIHSFKNLLIRNPFVCIGSFVEAAAFCQVQGRMMIRHSNEKFHEVTKNLKDYLTQKTIIFCIDWEEAEKLNKFLKSQYIKTLLAHENLSGEAIEEVRVEWTKYLSGMFPVMICTDQVLSELNISDAEFLIHYSVTVTSKSEFSRRFSVLMDNLQHTKSRSQCRVMIMFDETKESVHFKGVVDILKRLKVDLPTDWEKIANGLDLDHNIKIKNHPLCGLVKEIGFCDTNACPYRHRVIAEVDVPELNTIFIGDELKLMNLEVHSVSHFSARILGRVWFDEQTQQKKEYTFPPTELLYVNNNMERHFRNRKNHITIPEIHVGMICARKDVAQKFHRVQVMRILEKDPKSEKPSRVQVRNLEDGKITAKVSVRDLFELPKELAGVKLPMVDVYIANLAPFDEECSWTSIAVDKAKSWFKNNKGGEGTFILVKVLLHIGNSIWTDSVVSHTPCRGYADITSTKLEDEIVKHDLGIKNMDHLPKLLRLCRDGGLTEVNGRPLPPCRDEENLTEVNSHSPPPRSPEEVENTSIDECD